MDLNIIDQLIKMVNASALESLEVELDGFKVKLVNNICGKVAVATTNYVDITSCGSQEEIAIGESTDNTNYKYITSPIVGIFRTLSALSKGCIAEGSTVCVGDLICVIEAMKLINEIESDVDGEIVEILVKDGDQVEYGQNLFKLK